MGFGDDVVICKIVHIFDFGIDCAKTAINSFSILIENLVEFLFSLVEMH